MHFKRYENCTFISMSNSGPVIISYSNSSSLLLKLTFLRFHANVSDPWHKYAVCAFLKDKFQDSVDNTQREMIAGKN